MSDDKTGKKGTLTVQNDDSMDIGQNNVPFHHVAPENQDGFDLKALQSPEGVIAESPSVIARAASEAKPGDIEITINAQTHLYLGKHFDLFGTRIQFRDGFFLEQGDEVDGVIKGALVKPAFNLADGSIINKVEKLEVNQTLVTFGVNIDVKIPAANEPDPICVERTDVSDFLRGIDWDYLSNGSGRARAIVLTRPGEILPGGAREYVTIKSASPIVQSIQPKNSKDIASMLAMIFRIAGLFETNFAIPKQNILAGAAIDEDIVAFGDILTALITLGQDKMQTVKLDTRAGFVAGQTIPFFSNTSFQDSVGGGGLFSFTNNSLVGNRFEILEECMFTISFQASFTGTGENFGVSRNAVAFGIGGLDAASDDIKMTSIHSRDGDSHQSSVTLIAKPGDVFRAHPNNSINLGTAAVWNVIATARSLNKSFTQQLQDLGVL